LREGIADLRAYVTLSMPRSFSFPCAPRLRDAITQPSFNRQTPHEYKQTPDLNMDGSIASAVVLPEEPLPPASPPNGHKRRQSSVNEDSSKRPRLDHDDVTTEHQPENKPAAPKRRERGRERRLFGAVLGALSQNPSTTAAQKRRSEIEKRQLDQRKQQDEEGEQRKAERVARRKIQRWKEQKRFERDSVRCWPLDLVTQCRN
jgi:hypothetical protein